MSVRVGNGGCCVRQQKNNKKLFINIDANIIHDPTFKSVFTKEKINEFGFEAKDIVLEITEKSAVKDVQSFVGAIEHYQKQCFQIAIDDFGSGHSGLNRVCSFSPQFLKIDRNLIHNIDTNLKKQSAVGADRKSVV